MNQPLILHAPATGEGLALPLALTGLPAQIEGKPVHYRRKELAKVGRYVHRGTRQPFELSAARLDGIAAAFNARLAKGIRPFVATKHTLEPTAEDGKGYVVALHRQGESLYADLQLIGDDALSLCAANDVSLCTLGDQIDADGAKYPEVLHHVALTPNPALSNLGPFVKIAASAGGGGAVMEAPVYAAEKENRMDLKKLRTALGLADDVPDEQVIERAAERVTTTATDITAKDEQITALSADKARLEGELATANQAKDQATLALSAAQPKQLDDYTLSLTLDSFATKREQAIASGVISEAGMKQIDALVLPNGKPNGIALALSGDGIAARPFYARLCEIIAANPGVKANNAVTRATSIALSADGQHKEPMTLDRFNELRRQANLPPVDKLPASIAVA